ncbi:Monomeric sarcosine oxidase [Caulifigura coniformis]|uniref:Monomeric sarcosine oxidase n=1 Tax=Caulifigura coniformis TaxID=2527983 RepID=A0A517SN00_9PLAN|nr:N-methyl-L-tryptophan oxidase [Caulifigura coniformis]QDT57507.1 Monomeric sarcosine oxidase [Caulifigura coniformis]
MSVVTADVIVIGLGAMGGAAFRSLASRGLRVVGIEQHSVPHALGSSHGETRIIRKAYFEHPDYVPLLRRSYELWGDLETAIGQQLYHETGLLLIGPPDGEAIPGARLAAERHGIAIEPLSAADLRRRFPWITPREGDECLFEPEAGFLEVERCVEAQVRDGERRQGTAACGERVVEWSAEGRVARVVTDRGRYEAGALVIAGGPWASRLLHEMHVPLEVVRKPVVWFRSRPGAVAPTCGFFVEQEGRAFYGVPSLERGMTKLAEHTGGNVVEDADRVDRLLRSEDVGPLQTFAETTLRDIDSTPVRSAVCLYTLTPDRHFVIDQHPGHANVAVACGFSGHGFKFAPVVGEALADLAVRGESALPIGFLQNRSWT